jgi:hypothetical protein
MTADQLDKLIADDDLGLLKVKPKRTPQTTEEERLLEGFQEIIRFVEETDTAPSRLGTGINEKRLFTRLEAIRRSPQQCERLKLFDEYGLLTPVVEAEAAGAEEAAPASIDDILNDPFLAELDAEVGDIFNLKHVTIRKDIDSADYVAQRKPCKDFKLYEEQFQSCQQELKTEKRKLLPFANEQQIEVGKFYVLNGVLLLVAEVGERFEKKGKWNARLRLIFENGTESDMLLRSLASELYKDGKRVTELDEKLLNDMLVTGDDQASGFIYVLRSLSEHPEIKAIPHLYKIGLARRSIDTRIQNAANEPTYLMAPVALVSSFQCYNVNLPKMENLLHRFFDHATAKVQVKDLEGNYSTPKEWFSVPLPTIETAVRMLISGEIVNYVYDATSGAVKLVD